MHVDIIEAGPWLFGGRLLLPCLLVGIASVIVGSLLYFDALVGRVPKQDTVKPSPSGTLCTIMLGLNLLCLVVSGYIVWSNMALAGEPLYRRTAGQLILLAFFCMSPNILATIQWYKLYRAQKKQKGA